MNAINHVCGSEFIKHQEKVSWLAVGHVDEVFGLIEDDSLSPPCQFAINLASPKEALKVMDDPKNKNLPFFSFAGNPEEDDKADYKGVQAVCRLIKDYRAYLSNKNQKNTPGAPPKAIRAAWVERFLWDWISDARAGTLATAGLA